MSRLVEIVKNAAQKLPSLDSPEFGAKFDKFAKARVVLIGDASHGTSEFYRARAIITQRLIEKYGFNVVTIEADWPDAHAIDQFVRRKPKIKSLEKQPIFEHFPRWMWRNTEMQEFLVWLEKRNANLPLKKRTAFYGLDLYSMGGSIRSVIDYLERNDPETAEIAKERYACLQPWVEDPQKYGRVALNKGYAPCEKKVVRMLHDLLKKRVELTENDGEEYLDAEFNALVVKDAEQYYRAMYYGGAESWNLRDQHMFDVLMRLLELNPGGKAVVWAHNSHIGDARATAMSKQKEHNIGQLCRQHFTEPEEVTIIGCSTHTGTVAAADEWDMPMRIKDVLPSRDDSYERIMHDTGISSFLLDLREGQGNDELRQALMSSKRERFIGVIYRQDTELYSHYVKCSLPEQFDAFVWFDETKAVHAFETEQPDENVSVEDTYPFGL